MHLLCVQLLAQTTGSIAVRLQGVEEAVADLQNHALKPIPSATTTIAPAAPQPAAQPTGNMHIMFHLLFQASNTPYRN